MMSMYSSWTVTCSDCRFEGTFILEEDAKTFASKHKCMTQERIDHMDKVHKKDRQRLGLSAR